MANVKASRNVVARYGSAAKNAVGFSRGYNFAFFFIFAGALFGFTLSRMQYFNFNGIFCGVGGGITGAAPGECFWYRKYFKYRFGIILHLAGILPAALLAVFQFVPVIRHKFILFHRMNGWTIVLLALVGNAGAIIIAPHAFGGDLAVQSSVGTLVILTTVGLALAVYNVKRLQIDQHRAWMLRTWFYFGTIVTERIILIIGVQIISGIGNYYVGMECSKIDFMMKDKALTLASYSICESYYDDTDVNQFTAVKADFAGSVEQIAASLNMVFGMSMWLALFIHAVGVEVYLHLTPREAHRLREYSYQRQLEAGFSHPGSAGITSDRLGDAEKWKQEKTTDDSKMERE